MDGAIIGGTENRQAAGLWEVHDRNAVRRAE
jgi:hypothetical protein